MKTKTLSSYLIVKDFSTIFVDLTSDTEDIEEEATLIKCKSIKTEEEISPIVINTKKKANNINFDIFQNSKLNSTDLFEPSSKRTRSSSDSELPDLDLNTKKFDSEIVKPREKASNGIILDDLKFDSYSSDDDVLLCEIADKMETQIEQQPKTNNEISKLTDIKTEKTSLEHKIYEHWLCLKKTIDNDEGRDNNLVECKNMYDNIISRIEKLPRI